MRRIRVKRYKRRNGTIVKPHTRKIESRRSRRKSTFSGRIPQSEHPKFKREMLAELKKEAKSADLTKEEKESMDYIFPMVVDELDVDKMFDLPMGELVGYLAELFEEATVKEVLAKETIGKHYIDLSPKEQKKIDRAVSIFQY